MLVSFLHSLRVSIGHGFYNELACDYSSMAYWYRAELHHSFFESLPINLSYPQPATGNPAQSAPYVHARLQADPPARVADIGCGYGWSSLGMAKGYPNVYVDGFDLDAPSIERAHFQVRDAGEEGWRCADRG